MCKKISEGNQSISENNREMEELISEKKKLEKELFNYVEKLEKKENHIKDFFLHLLTMLKNVLITLINWKLFFMYIGLAILTRSFFIGLSIYLFYFTVMVIVIVIPEMIAYMQNKYLD